MAHMQLSSMVLAVIALMVLGGCAQLLPPGWNTTHAQPPTGAIVGDMEETDNDIAVLEEAEESSEDMDDTTSVAQGDENLPRKVVTEGDIVNFPNLKATDPDGDPITYTFTPPLDASGTWQTTIGDAGEYQVTITASDGKNSVSQVVAIYVNPKNRPPEIRLAAKEITIKEGESVTLVPEVVDPDGDKVTLTFDGWMTSASRGTDFDDAGFHEVELIASDGQSTAREIIRVIVENINRPPVINPISDTIIKEGDKITVNPTATDPDGDRVTLLYSSPISSDGVWQTTTEEVGKYRINVTATDGSLNAMTSFLLIVESLNQPPVIQMADLVTVDEGNTVTLNPVIEDPEGDELTITYSGWMRSTTYKTTYEDAGSHLVTIKVNDGINTAKKDLTVMVNDVNRVPQFGPGSFN